MNWLLPSTKPQKEIRNPNELESIKENLLKIYQGEVSTIAKKFKYKMPPSASEINSSPIVLLLGNHSSGKSSFINYFLDKNIQLASAAPLDDGFTIFAKGTPTNADAFIEQRGASLVLDNRLPFHSLQTVSGKNFLGRVVMKYVPDSRLQDLMLVDTPGMIDTLQNRDYDFMQAIKWFTNRADLILFFFDPEKPGTTGESLRVFTEILNGEEHKLLIVMNKIDTVGKLGDLTRTFGTLCWNLAKVIPYKDMPLIYPCFVPQTNPASNLEEFSSYRDLLIKKILNSPARHVDTLITDCKKYTEKLSVHARVISAAKADLQNYKLRLGMWVLLFILVTSIDFYHFSCLTSFLPVIVGLFIIYLIVASVLIKQKEKKIVRNLDSYFYKEFGLELQSEPENYQRVWQAVRISVENTVKQHGLSQFSVLADSSKQSLKLIGTSHTQKLVDQLRGILLS